MLSTLRTLPRREGFGRFREFFFIGCGLRCREASEYAGAPAQSNLANGQEQRSLWQRHRSVFNKQRLAAGDVHRCLVVNLAFSQKGFWLFTPWGGAALTPGYGHVGRWPTVVEQRL